ncbi:MAG: ABC-F family ATP-binding cassette domain-containing protein [Firmicutes bacterium]|nr:ABC-F family ATP-binding cassette domain-containing protein [Bacillota bacterium]
MNILSIENITKRYGEKILFNNISLGINEGDKIGLIGVNGTGKTTLLEIIANFENQNLGNITKRNDVRIEYLSQNPEFSTNLTVLEQVFKGNSEEMKILRKYEHTLKNIKGNPDDKKIQNNLLNLNNKMDALDIWELENEAKTILTKLGINNFDAKVSTLSGGQRKRIALASALINPADLLILDEPTNHMDNATISWLEEYLNQRDGALLMVTHDRYFLDRVVNKIIEIDNKNLYSYHGNYSTYLQKKAERKEKEEKELLKKQKLYKKELAWIKSGVKARATKQKARKQRFEKLKKQTDDIPEESIDISVGYRRLGNKIINIKNINKSYENITLINNFSYTLLKTDRIGIVGPNGIGKTTLMNIISKDTLPDSGIVEIGETVKIGYFSQNNSHMDGNKRVIEYVKEKGEYITTAKGNKITASQMLENFLFSKEMQWSYISKLSGGEKRRLYLLKILMDAPNVLLLDEPTNDLDIQTLTILEDYLDNFNGAIITVSHDRYFLDKICNKILAFEGNGKIKQYTGNYFNYSQYIKDKALDNSNSLEKTHVKQDKKKIDYKNNKPLKFSYKEKIEYENIEGEIETLENNLEKINTEIEKTISDYTKLEDLLNEKKDIENKLEEKLERWTYLTELAQKIENQKNI